MIDGMDDGWDDVRRLYAEVRAAPFPDCRGEEVDGVDLVLIDADLAGCVMHFLGQRFRDDVFQRQILEQIVGELDRIVPQMTGEVAVYFERECRLAHATLTAVVSG